MREDDDYDINMRLNDTRPNKQCEFEIVGCHKYYMNSNKRTLTDIDTEKVIAF